MKNYLEQIFFEGYATKEGSFSIKDINISYKFRTLSFEDHQKAIKSVADLGEVATLVASHYLILEIISYTLLKIDNAEFKNSEEVKKYLFNRPSSLVTSLGKIQGGFEKEVENMFTSETIEEVFSEAPQISEK